MMRLGAIQLLYIKSICSIESEILESILKQKLIINKGGVFWLVEVMMESYKYQIKKNIHMQITFMEQGNIFNMRLEQRRESYYL